MAYRGYLIQTSPFRLDVTIAKDGHHIATAMSVKEAMRVIDALLA